MPNNEAHESGPIQTFIVRLRLTEIVQFEIQAATGAEAIEIAHSKPPHTGIQAIESAEYTVVPRFRFIQQRKGAQ